MGALQLLLSVCCQRDRSILRELQLETLGKVSELAEEEFRPLSSLKAVVMPRNEVSACLSQWVYCLCLVLFSAVYEKRCELALQLKVLRYWYWYSVV